MNKIQIQMAIAVVATLTAATSAQAAWTFTGSGDVGKADTVNGSTVKVTSVSAVSAMNGGTLATGLQGTAANETAGVPNVTGASGFSGTSAGTTWATANLSFYTGTTNPVANWGYGSQSDGTVSPNHAFDNGPSTDSNGNISGIGNTEAMIIGFSSAVTLNSITLGYKFNDADISVFAYTGSGTPALTGFGTSLQGMATAGWSLVGNYADLAGSKGDANNNPVATTDLINTNGVTSSYWMISAYNTAYGTGAGLDQGNDYFKILGVGAGPSCVKGSTGCISNGTGVPEPTSLALVAIAGLGFVGARRRVLKGSTAA